MENIYSPLDSSNYWKLVSIEVANMNDESAFHLLVVNPCSKNYVTYALEAYNITPPILFIGYFSPSKFG
jgi:hypothetical protein